VAPAILVQEVGCTLAQGVDCIQVLEEGSTVARVGASTPAPEAACIQAQVVGSILAREAVCIQAWAAEFTQDRLIQIITDRTKVRGAHAAQERKDKGGRSATVPE